MIWYKRLRWRLIGSQILVVLVGVGMMAVATGVLVRQVAPPIIESQLTALQIDAAQRQQVGAAMGQLFRNGVLTSVLLAALAALVAGVVSSWVLWRILIAPLQEMAESSQRIANGRYDERVQVPDNSGEAMAQLVVNFNQMAAALAGVEQQRVTLLGNISHELRTPLTGLKGYLEGLVDGLFPATEETFGWMTAEVDRLQRLVQDIQHLSRVEAGQIKLNMQTFSLEEIVQRVATQLQPQVQEKGVVFRVEMPKTAVSVHADPDRAAQVMLNLLGNAIRYTPAGGEVVLGVSQNGRFAKITVADTGIGIPAAALPYLFERFYRVDQSRARKSGGSGIGLTISRHLVWAMGGEIRATSDGENQGSQFAFTLPLTG